MMKIVIVGTNGLAQFIAHFLSTTTSHQFFMLSRNANPGLIARGWQVLQVNYADTNDLKFKLAGADTVISTICGSAQIALIDAAAAVHVRRFIPSEFEGSPSSRPVHDVLDNGRRAAIQRLLHHEHSGMRFTIFTCGIFFERFAPRGMAGSAQIGVNSAIGQEGDYLMDFRRMRAHFPYYSSAGRPVYVCMTSARDVARFVVAALDVSSWPREFRLCAERMTVSHVVTIGQQVRGQAFEVSSYSSESLQSELAVARAMGDLAREMRAHNLMATAEGRYDFNTTNLNQLVTVRPERFPEWLFRVWMNEQP